MKNLDIKIYFEEIEKIMGRLDILYSTYSDEFYKQYKGNSFTEQDKLAIDLDNLILASTHETASTLAFITDDIKNLIEYIHFRKKYSSLSSDELKEIIDNENISSNFKLKIRQTDESLNIKTIQKEWNQLFFNKSYEKITQKILKK